MLFTRQPKLLKWITKFLYGATVWASSFFGRLQKEMQSKSEVNHTTGS